MREVLITSSVLIVTIAALRFLLRGRASLRLQYALWLLVAVRLLVPVPLMPSPVSVLNAVLPAAVVPVAQPAAAVQGSAPPVTAQMVPSVAGNHAPAPPDWDQPTAPAPRGEVAVLPVLWLCGGALMALWLLGTNVAFRWALCRDRKRLEGVDASLPVYVSSSAASPCLVGLLRPAIYLTPDCLGDEGRLRHIMAHELTHHRHGDHIWTAVRCLCLCVYWFDPLVWLAAALSRRDCELACDEGTLRRLGEGERTAYGRTLLSLVVPKTAPSDLLRAATTMTVGKQGLRERISLIAKKPKMLAVTVVCVVLVAAVAVACTFTGPKGAAEPTTTPEPTPAAEVLTDTRALAERLADLPEELRDRVMAQNADGINLLTTYYFEEDHISGESDSGLICSVVRYSQFGLEQSFVSWENSGGYTVLGRDDDWYYVMESPTDINFDPAHAEAYQAAATDLKSWIGSRVRTQQGVTNLENDPLYQGFLGECLFPGNHIDVVYHPYHGTAETIDPVDVYLLSQPVRQGAGGIWCVDREFFGRGGSWPVVPDTEVTMAEYYADLQAQADAGHRPDLLDPLEVAMTYAQAGAPSYLTVSTEAIEVGEIYQGEPTAGELVKVEAKLTAMQTPITVYTRLETLTRSGGGDVILSLTDADGTTKDLVVDAGAGNGGNYISGHLSEYDWVQTSAVPNYFEPRGGYITLYEMGKNRCFRYAVKYNVVIYRENGIDYYYEARLRTSTEEDVFATDIYHFMRRWFDEAERSAVWPAVESASTDFGQIAQTWGEALGEQMRTQISQGSAYEVQNAAFVSAEVYDTIPGDDSQFCATITMAYQIKDPHRTEWMAGAGVSEITEGPYAGWWADFHQYKLVREDSVWRMAEMGGGITLEQR